MAKRRNQPFGDFDGKLGRLVFYRLNGKPCVRETPTREKPFTVPELNNQSRFSLAAKYAEAVLTDPVQRARYEKAAREAGCSAQNVAVSDFMRRPTLAEIDLSRYTGQGGEFIKIVATEAKVGAAQVSVVIADGAKAVLEQGPATMENDGVSWWYPAKLNLPPDQPVWITVTAADQPGNSTTRTLRHTTGG